jgi:2-amino-4-hydroxy-6-hydroxymethyldihydropteridine diphosphokinase
MREPVSAFIALGANLGDAQATLLWAMDQIAALPLNQTVRASSLYASAPIDSTGPDYINAVMHVLTGYGAPELLSQLQKIEQLAGRERPYRNAPRTLDLDLLLFGSARIDSKHLQIPHPRMFERAFVLLPLAEISPERVTPAQLMRVQDQVCDKI